MSYLFDLYCALKNCNTTEIENLKGSKDRLTKILPFKTGGMRGVEGEGFCNISPELCKLLGLVLCKKYSEIIVGYDHRCNSETYAKILVSIFKINGKKYRVYKECVTPYLAFECGRSNSGAVGVMITASHNPKEYNGFKVYENGAQLTVERADEIFLLMTNPGLDITENFDAINFIKSDWNGILSPIDYTAYFESFKISSALQENLKIIPAFSGLYGVSCSFVEKACEYFNIKIDMSSMQNVPNSEFPGIKYPNPEIKENYIPFFNHESGVIFMCDPDGDRFGLAVKNTKLDINKIGCGANEWRVYDGNEIIQLFTWLFINHLKVPNLRLVNTHYCGSFFSAVSKKHGIPHCQVGAGFRNVSKAVEMFLTEDASAIVLAYEDALGFLLGSEKEKDGIKALVLMSKIIQIETVENIFKLMEKDYGVHSTYTVHLRVEDPEVVIKQLDKKETPDKITVKKRISGTESMVKVYSSSSILTKDELVKVVDEYLKN